MENHKLGKQLSTDLVEHSVSKSGHFCKGIQPGMKDGEETKYKNHCSWQHAAKHWKGKMPEKIIIEQS